MNDNATAHPRFLPQLDPTKSPPAASSANAGWTEHGNGVVTLAKYSAALVVAGRDTPPERLKSIPSPWSRLLLFEQALFQREHPAHAQVLAEWRGMLGCLGLSDYLNLQMAATPVDFDGAAGSMQVLRSMVPAGDAATLWDHHVLISIGGRLMGGTSPRTLVFTGIRAGVPPSVPFQRDSRLADPTAHYREAGDGETLLVIERWLARLGEWLKEAEGQLNGFLGLQPAAAGSDRVSRAELVKKLLAQWHDDTVRALDAAGPVAAPDVSFGKSRLISNAFPDRHPARDIFGALRFARVTHPEPRRSDLRLRDGEKAFNPGARGVLLRDENPYTGQIQLPAGQHGSVKRGRFELALSGEQLGDPNAPDLGAFFEPRLVEVRDANAAHVSVLQIDGKQYLFPFRSDILAHLTPEQVVSFTRAAGDPAAGVRVTLNIPLHNDLVLRYEQEYLARDVVSGAATPNLSVWPNFHAQNWPHHFYFVEALEQPHLTLAPVGGELEKPRTSSDSAQTWGRLAGPVRGWTGSLGEARGLLLAHELPFIPSKGAPWDVSVDFGSTHTRIFRATEGVASGKKAEIVELTPRSLVLLGTPELLADSFFPAPGTDLLGATQEPRSLLRLPLGPVGVNADGAWSPPDGVIYWRSLLDDRPVEGLRANLKWHRSDTDDLPAFHSYISQLYLSVAAEAAAAGASVRSLVTAYPSVFPDYLRHEHEQQWKTLDERYGVNIRPAVSESLALAAYLAAEREANVGTNMLAIDVGGSTSDLAVWMGGTRAVGDSVRMAGDILSRLLAVDAAAREAIRKAAAAKGISATELRWRDAGGMENGLIFNALLRFVAQKDKNSKSTLVLAQNMYKGMSSPGERVIAHAGYLYATVSYLLGMMVRRQGGRADRYEIHFAGHGSEFLTWLDLMADDASKQLPAAFFRAGLNAGGQPVIVDVRLPGRDVKQEVGRGLLAQPVGETVRQRHHSTFVGESGFFGAEDGEGWDAELGPETISRLQAPSQPVGFERMTQITNFVDVFTTDPVAQPFGTALGISRDKLDTALRDRIHDRLFGPQSAWKAATRTDSPRDHSMLEPFFVTEAKALLEHVTQNRKLFSA